MKIFLVVSALSLLALTPSTATAKDRKAHPRGMIESMQSMPCGAKEKGLNGLGALWGSIGVTSISSNQKLCPQYLLRTDQLEYQIRPTDTKHPIVLPVGHEAEYKVKKDRLFLKVVDGDRKTRTYQVVAMQPVKSAGAEESTASYRSAPAMETKPMETKPIETKPAIPLSASPPQE